jgi:cold shock CspA family protein
MPIGTIAALIPEKPFGFIKPAGGGDDLFFHQTEFKGDFSELTLGLEVTYKNDLHSEKPRALEVALVPSSFGSEIDRPKRHPKSLRKKPKWRKTDEEKDKDAARAKELGVLWEKSQAVKKQAELDAQLEAESQAESSQAESSQAESSQAESSQAESSQAESSPSEPQSGSEG